ncbi:chitin deacetylase [Actinomortierella ambigua]|nr:chitin deacetylase [Actinomortierella ambigua]
MKIATFASSLLLAAFVRAQVPFDFNNFPPADAIPPLNSPEMQAWLKEIDLSDVPNLSLTKPMSPGGPANCTDYVPIPAERCWWTCQGCPGTDVEDCPNPGDWGLTFDDGPTPHTAPLLAFLKQAGLKATFFIKGTNAVKHPEILKQELAEGHHLASHTWSHHALTTLTNQEIVAEVKWAEKAVLDITGMRMKYIRPPYGDIDNRVRKVIAKMGYTVIDWSQDFDTLDYSLNDPKNRPKLNQYISTFQAKVNAHAGPKGIISLQHDLYDVTTEYARQMLGMAAQPGFKFKIKTVADCLGDANGYQGGVPPTVPGGGNNNGTTGGNDTGKGTNPKVPGGKNAAGALEFSLMTVGSAVLVALAGSMGMLL